MILDLPSYGAGVGLVMIGWMTGIVISYVLSMVQKVPTIGVPGGK